MMHLPHTHTIPHWRVKLLIILLQFLFINSFTSYTRSCIQSSRRQQPININLIQSQLCASPSSSTNNSNDNIDSAGIRLNKVFKATHSRREADKLIESGRVSVNGEPVLNKGGMRVIPFQDVVALDGKVVRGWEKMNAIDKHNDSISTQKRMSDDNIIYDADSSDGLNTASFEYVKYFKPLGVTCTTDSRIRDNIIDAIVSDGYNPRHRVYPVGRLDKETSGLIVLTSDGRMVNSVLRGERKQPKVYKVMVNGRLTEEDLQMLRDGMVIKTVAQRKGKSEEENTLIAKTKPCKVTRIGPCACQMTLVEGRNRQIRKMMEALGFRVVKLHRLEFMGIQLGSLRRPGDWEYLDEDEMRLVENALKVAQEEDG